VARGAEVSPDGKLLAYDFENEQTKRMQIVVVNFADGSPFKTFTPPVTNTGWRWAPDSRAVVYKDTVGGVSNLWRLPLDGTPATQITDFDTDIIRYFSYSRDGKHLALSRGNVIRDAVLITEEK
jgi:Tol biopolymer transport system component